MDESLGSIIANEKAPVESPPEVVEKDDKQVEVVTTTDSAAPSVAKKEIQPTEKLTQAPLTATEHAALMALKVKTKDLERQLAEARGKKPEDKPDFYADPEKAVESKVQEIVAPIREKFFKQSVSSAATAHSDFEQAAVAFEKMVEANPALHKQWLESDDPGEFIYSMGMSTPENREKLTTDLKGQLTEKDARIAALTQELEAVKKGQAELAAIPKSLNNVATSAPKAADTDDEGIESIVRFKTG